jgi:hypothetical protein
LPSGLLKGIKSKATSGIARLNSFSRKLFRFRTCETK